MTLMVYDWEFQPLGMIDEYTTCTWTRRFRSRGECTLTVPYSEEALEILCAENWLIQSGGDEAMVITTVTLTKDQTGADTINVTAYGLFQLLNRRVCDKEYEDVSMTPQKMIYTLFKENITQPSVKKRILPYVKLNTRSDYKDLDEEEFSIEIYQQRLGDLIEEQLTATGLGCVIHTDIRNKTHTFDFLEPADHTASGDSPVIFSVDYGTLGEQTFVHSHEQYANMAYIMGSDFNNDAVYTYDAVALQKIGDDLSGYERIEIGVTASDIGGGDTPTLGMEITNDNEFVSIPDTDETPSPARVKKLLLKRGRDELKNSYPEESTFTGSVTENDSLVYKTDWDLGDRVTCTYNRWGISADLTITEIQEEYSNTGRTISVTFGEGSPDFRKSLCALIRRTK